MHYTVVLCGSCASFVYFLKEKTNMPHWGLQRLIAKKMIILCSLRSPPKNRSAQL